jgi:hypothetical protein
MIFKHATFSIAALAALTVTASAADMPVKAPRVVDPPQQVSGYVELYGGWARTKFDNTFCQVGFPCSSFSDTQNGWVLGGAGRATWWWAPNYSVQLDVQGEGTSYKDTFNGGFNRRSAHGYLIGGHANWRNPGTGLLGIFGGAGDATTVFTTANIRHGLIGGEGQVYWGPVTLYGQGGYASTLGQISSGFFDSFQAWFVRGTARVYVNPNFRLEGTVFYADGDFDFVPAAAGNSIDFKTWLWRGKAEYKFATSPFSIFALYEGSRTTSDRVGVGFTSTQRVTDNRVMGGIRLYINENTLQFNDRNGTTLDIISPFNVPSAMFTQGGG